MRENYEWYVALAYSRRRLPDEKGTEEEVEPAPAKSPTPPEPLR